jgi:hypothetical protein
VADIKQAAKWMQEGKRVKRHGADWSMKANKDGYTLSPQGGSVACMVDDLLADDWEIAVQEQEESRK